MAPIASHAWYRQLFFADNSPFLSISAFLYLFATHKAFFCIHQATEVAIAYHTTDWRARSLSLHIIKLAYWYYIHIKRRCFDDIALCLWNAFLFFSLVVTQFFHSRACHLLFTIWLFSRLLCMLRFDVYCLHFPLTLRRKRNGNAILYFFFVILYAQRESKRFRMQANKFLEAKRVPAVWKRKLKTARTTQKWRKPHNGKLAMKGKYYMK